MFSFVFVFTLFFFSSAQKLLHRLKSLSIADMGLIPYELLVPLGQLKALNLSGNHLVNVSMQIIHPVNGLEVCRQLERGVFLFFALLFDFLVGRRPRDLSISSAHVIIFFLGRHLIYHEINWTASPIIRWRYYEKLPMFVWKTIHWFVIDATWAS